MYECIDLNNHIYSTEEYCLLKKDKKHPKQIYCPFCINKVFLRGEHSKEKTHFMHSKGTSCSTIDYKKLFSSNGVKKSKAEILSLKFNIVSFSYNIFNHIQNTFNITISPQEFTDILEKLGKKKIIELLDITPSIIPYIWINELGRYKDKLFLYTNSNNKEINKLWNLSPNSKKNIVLCISKDHNKKITRTHIPVDTSFLDNPSTRIPISFIKQIIPNILNALNIDKEYEELIIRDLLSSE